MRNNDKTYKLVGVYLKALTADYVLAFLIDRSAPYGCTIFGLCLMGSKLISNHFQLTALGHDIIPSAERVRKD